MAPEKARPATKGHLEGKCLFCFFVERVMDGESLLSDSSSIAFQKDARQARCTNARLPFARASFLSQRERGSKSYRARREKARKDCAKRRKRPPHFFFFVLLLCFSLPSSSARLDKGEKHNTYSFLASLTAVVMAGSLASGWGGKRGIADWKAKGKKTKEKL